MIRLFSLFILGLVFSSLTTVKAEIPTLNAKSYLLADYHSGKVLMEKKPNSRIEPASITKLMTSYVIYKALKNQQIFLDDLVTVSEKAWRMEGSRMFIEVDSQVSVDELIKGMTIQSGNDASVALAEYTAGSEKKFVEMMNAEAKQLGMQGTHYANVTGMPHKTHYTTAQDILILTTAMIRDFPEEYPIFAEKHYEYNKIKQSNRNRLLWEDKRVDGVKTGHTESAGYCLVASGVSDGMRLISIVLGTESDKDRTLQSKRMLNYGFRVYETRQLYKAGQEIEKIKVWKAEQSEVPLGVTQDLFVTFPRGKFKQLKAALDRPSLLQAPLKKDQAIGRVKVQFEDEILAEIPLVSLSDIRLGGFFSRMLDSVYLMME